MNLVLEIEFLTGVCRAARGPGSDTPDWPPQPDRVFSALASAWGTCGELPEERAALEWLEEQPPPVILASGYTARTAPDVFVPPNDPKASRARKTYLRVLPEARPRQPRRFPVARLDDPNMELIWPEVPTTGVLERLNAIASRVGYLGHSASLVRCRFLAGTTKFPNREPMPARRRTYLGRLRELEALHRARPQRPMIRPGAPVFTASQAKADSPAEWLILEAVAGDVPDIRASALVCRLIRQALMAGYRKAGREDAIPESISGHASDGAPARKPHLAILPMAFVGSHHADGRVFGFGIVPPPGESLLRIDGFRHAFENVATYRPREQRRVLTLQGPPLRGALALASAPDEEDRKRSLSPNPYIRDSHGWATVTPIVLDRHLKRKDDAEIRELIAFACENAGLPRPDSKKIRVGKHSSIRGAPAARPLTGEPPWTRWKVPDSLKTRQLVHAVIDFEQNVQGPVLLGAGRYTGLGLCRGIGQ